MRSLRLGDHRQLLFAISAMCSIRWLATISTQTVLARPHHQIRRPCSACAKLINGLFGNARFGMRFDFHVIGQALTGTTLLREVLRHPDTSWT
jgi:hypothetical protein